MESFVSKLSEARSVSLDVLSYAQKHDSYAKEVLHSSKAYQALSKEDKAFASKLVFGVTSSQGILDECINTFVSKPKNLAPAVRCALRISCYEILYLEKSPHAAVSQGVELVRSVAHRASGLANAVLRKIAEYSQEYLQGGKDELETLCRQCGFSYELASMLQKSIGSHATEEIVRAQTQGAPLCIYVSTDDVLQKLVPYGLQPFKGLKNGYTLTQRTEFIESKDPRVLVMDASAQIVAQIALGDARGTFLEIGSGRGSKTSYFALEAEKRQADVQLFCLEQFAYKNAIAKKRVEEISSISVKFIEADASKDLSNKLDMHFDSVFIDSPCSGSGTLRRHPELVWTTSKRKITSLNTLQLNILSEASKWVKVGGELIYASCSVLPEENEEIIEKFLQTASGQGFEWAPVFERKGITPELKALLIEEDARMYFKHLPSTGKADGHFCARLIKKK